MADTSELVFFNSALLFYLAGYCFIFPNSLNKMPASFLQFASLSQNPYQISNDDISRVEHWILSLLCIKKSLFPD